MSIKAVIFDKDGTLFPYSLWGIPLMRLWEEEMPLERLSEKKKNECILAFSRAVGVLPDGSIAKNGLFFRRNYVKTFFSLLYITLRFTLNPYKAAKAFLKIKGRCRYGFEDALRSYDFSFLKKAIMLLHREGIETALFTNDTRESVEILLSVIGKDSFHYIVTDESKIKKPDTRIIKQYASVSGLKAEEIALVSDSPKDLRMAQKAGVGAAIGIRGTAEEKSLTLWADFTASSLEEALDFIF